MRYVIDYGSTHITSAEEFDTLAEAETWQVEVLLHDPTVGVLLTFDAWALTSTAQGIFLQSAKEIKQSALVAEGITRFPPDITSIPVVRDIILMVQTLSAVGGEAAAVLVAYDDAVIQINALPTVPQVEAYNVVTEPNWP